MTSLKAQSIELDRTGLPLWIRHTVTNTQYLYIFFNFGTDTDM